MSTRLSKSSSVPGLMKLGMDLPKMTGHGRKQTFGFLGSNLGSAVDLYKTQVDDEARTLARELKTPAWRLSATEPFPIPPPTAEDLVPSNMRVPAITPAWLKHDKQVLRFYGYFQEAVSERPDEVSRYRNVSIMYCMEDGTLLMSEPKVENSGISQGRFLKRHQVPRDDGQGFVGPDDFRVGIEITIYGRTYHITGCDRFTRWFYEQNGIHLEEDEPLVMDLWQTKYKLRKTSEKGGNPLSKSVVDAKNLMKFQNGQPPADKKMIQFLLNDRKVLRFMGFWDDPTPYGVRVYMVIHYYLCDNTIEINESHTRNSGRWATPVFMTRTPLSKTNGVNAVPGLLSADAARYMPEDLKLGEPLNVWNRNVMLYDCDDFTRKFYQGYLGMDQWEGKIDVSTKPVRHVKLAPPPHNGIGKPEDSIINCEMIVPKPPKSDLVKMMTLTGEILRFEAKMMNGEPEDECRRLVIAYYPMDDEVQVFELEQRNSGHMGGKFLDKRKVKNVDTGDYFKLSDLFVGASVLISAQPLLIIRADEHALRFLEARPQEFPCADPIACAQKVALLADEPELNDPMGIEPDRLKALASDRGLYLVDHEVITLLRRFGIEGSDGSARIVGASVLEAAGY